MLLENSILLIGNMKAPNNTQNFFGLNETEFPNTGDQTIKYYRSRYNLLKAQLYCQSNKEIVF
jgi:hypothetical protein